MDMDVLSWNCRGIYEDSTVRALKNLISQSRPQIVFLCETKISTKQAFDRLQLALGFAHGTWVLSEGLSGGPGMFWNDDVRVHVGSSSAHHIDIEIDGGPSNPRWRLTGFYGWPPTSDRDFSWQLLKDLADLDSLPWVVIGDFNEILNSGEKKGGKTDGNDGHSYSLGGAAWIRTYNCSSGGKENSLCSIAKSIITEETFWRQRAKVTWLRDGDKNTSFFHRKASNRKRKNNLKGLYNDLGEWVEDDEGVEQVVSSYFQSMFTAEDVDIEAMNTTLNAIQPCISSEMNEQLRAQYSSKKIKCALFQMYPTKSPSPDELISPFQSAFVPRRLITDNILVANEIAHFVHNIREGADGFMALKYSFLVRGKPRGFVIPSRGLRQGDPLSPYLFLLGAEGFSVLLKQKQLLGLLPGINICEGAPLVNHLLFTNDSMLYANATLENCYQIQDVLETYGRASGQLVNFQKSFVVFSRNVPEFLQEDFSSFMGVETVDNHEKYLGLPTYVGRKKTATFQCIKRKLGKRILNWQGKLLSGAGRDILIRVVVQSLPNYAMSVFQLTKKICEDLEQLCAKFWWGSTMEKRKIHWKNWKALCNPKEEGGLDFRSLVEFNNAMLAKQAWRVIGDGLTVDVVSDAWIPRTINFKPNELTMMPPHITKVHDLISPSGGWNNALISTLFSAEDATAIAAIPLPSHEVTDRIVWHLEKSGIFSVKTAYRYSFHHSQVHQPFDLTVGVAFWKKIWKVNIPNGAKNLQSIFVVTVLSLVKLYSPTTSYLRKEIIEFAMERMAQLWM
ncbi:hypothetical protein ACLB2K_022265 [Fragaria x ananassa]